MVRTAIAQALQLGAKGVDQMTTLETRNCRLVQARDPKPPVPYVSVSGEQSSSGMGHLEVMQSPSLEIFKTQLNRAAANLT